MNCKEFTQRVRDEAYRLGFDGCGFARAGRLEKEERRLEEWLNQHRHGTMQWMENHFDKRVDPTLLVPGSRSVVSVIASYYHPVHKQLTNNEPKIAKYAHGRDYHKVFKQKLKKLFSFTEKLNGGLHGRVFVDSAPVLDKAWAVRCGLGWMGKNSNILNKKIGSFFLIGEMITDAEFLPSVQVTDHCGSCTRCIEACPTNAIYEPYRVDATKCISYLTIELKDNIPEEQRDALGEWMYGCDICQDVCPWNRNARFTRIDDFKPRKMVDQKIDFWEELTPDQYADLFNGTPVRRAKYSKLKDNIRAVTKNLNNSSLTSR